MTQHGIIAVDWGTTNRRTYYIDNGTVTQSQSDAVGVIAVPPGGFADEVALLRDRHDGAPILLAGMVGSNRGWLDAGYVSTAATLEILARAVVRPCDGVVIVPGISHIDNGRGDVMRGEEVQLLGAVSAGLAPRDALLCQPGTHCKWARMRSGAIACFVTAMTGEIFALLKNHALIGQDMTGPVTPDQGFIDGVREAARGDILGSLFGVRPAGILGLRNPQDTAAFVSGLLIGTDCAAHVRKGEQIYVLAEPALGALYGCAIAEQGGSSVLIDSQAAFVAGAAHLWEYLS